MSDALKASVEKIKQSTSRLNKLSDEAARVVAATEAFLAKEVSVGVEAYVEVERAPLIEEGGGPMEYTVLCFARHNGKFRIIVSIGTDEENTVRKPWVEWSRDIKLETVKHLPTLLERIATAVDDEVSEAAAATAKVADVLRVFEKGGK